MKNLKDKYITISTLLAFALIPLSGFATDVYIPSLPAMANFFGASKGDIQLSLVVFVISNGLSQLFVGSLLDSFGRYRLNISALLIFAISSFVIAFTNDITVLLSMRVIQGITVAIIVVSKRAFFLDMYSGTRLKHYTSLFSIIWATAPIIAPFLGGLLQYYFGWQSNFYFLGFTTLALLSLELLFNGETLKAPQPFQPATLLTIYISKLGTSDFFISLMILGVSFSNVIVFNMVSPFIIEHVFHKSAVTIGNAALFSGLAVMIGGLLSKVLINSPLNHKIRWISPLLEFLSVLMISLMNSVPSVTLMMAIVMLIHIVNGFTFNTFYTFALSRFSTHGGIVSGITGGITFVTTSIVSFSLVNILKIQDPAMLGYSYLVNAILISVSFFFFMAAQKRALNSKVVTSEKVLQPFIYQLKNSPHKN